MSPDSELFGFENAPADPDERADGKSAVDAGSATDPGQPASSGTPASDPQHADSSPADATISQEPAADPLEMHPFEAPAGDDAVSPESAEAAPSSAAATAESTGTASGSGSSDQVRGMPWDDALPILRGLHDGTSDGILFCVYKLVQDPEATLREFRDEAEMRGIKLSGRGLHSAKVLLGMAQPAVRRKKAEPAAPEASEPALEPKTEEREMPDSAPARSSTARRRTSESRGQREPVAGLSVEDALRDAVGQIQLSAREEATRLRAAMRRAIEILDEALGDD